MNIIFRYVDFVEDYESDNILRISTYISVRMIVYNDSSIKSISYGSKKFHDLLKSFFLQSQKMSINCYCFNII